MGFTYSLTNLDDPVNQVRLRFGDTEEKLKMLDDEEIQQILTEQGLSLTVTLSTSSANSAAVTACKRAIAKLSREVDRSNLGMSATRSQQITHLRDVLKSLKSDLSATAGPFVGGVSISRKESLAADADFTGVKNQRDQHAIRGTSRKTGDEFC